jgi:hypothetical protein
MTAKARSGCTESAASVDAIGAQSSSASQHMRPRSFAIAMPALPKTDSQCAANRQIGICPGR